jgi:hypothetical protein
MRSFLKLLSRVANTDAAELQVKLPPSSVEILDSRLPTVALSQSFNPDDVSEVVWAQWRASVIRHGLGKESLGRFATTLQGMTRVIWSKPMETYAEMTLGEIRRMRTHGEKRVNAILDVFYRVHSIVANMGTQEHLVLRIVPRLIDGVESWIAKTLQTPGLPENDEIVARFVDPLMAQIRIDATEQIVQLAENRLGFNGPVTSVRQMARERGLTRARVYQLLNEINDIMTVRWPTGRHQVYELIDKFEADARRMESPPDLAAFHAAIELFYPGSRRGASGRLEPCPTDEISSDESDEEESDAFAPNASVGSESVFLDYPGDAKESSHHASSV